MRATQSIERLLLVWVLGALTLGAAALVGVSYSLYLQELGEVFDENLKQVALATAYHHAVTTGRLAEGGPGTPAMPASAATRTGSELRLPQLPQIYDSEGEFDFITLVWKPDGTLIFTSDPTVAIPFITETGIQHLKRADGEWHVFSIVTPEAIVQAAQRDTSRGILAAEVASKMVLPLAALVVLISALLVFALRRGLRSLDLAAASVAQRTAHSLQPVSPEPMPREIHPLILALNGLMARLSDAFTIQRRFVADAAHELRTPVTALRLQLQLLERARDPAERKTAIDDLKQGVERSQHLIEQLLNLSRYEPDDVLAEESLPASRAAAVDLAALAKDVVGTMSVKAEHRRIDLGAETEGSVFVQGDREELLVLLNNLVENALRYTQEGGVVDVRAAWLEGHPALQVIDNGPGIPRHEQARVFDRFYRGASSSDPRGAEGTGSGLGLAIVKAIAERHRAWVSLHEPAGGKGLEVRVVFGSG